MNGYNDVAKKIADLPTAQPDERGDALRDDLRRQVNILRQEVQQLVIRSQIAIQKYDHKRAASRTLLERNAERLRHNS